MKNKYSAVYEYLIDSSCANASIKDYLLENHGYSQRTFRYIIKKGRLTLNGKDVYFTHETAPGDVIRLYFPVERPDAVSSAIDIDVVHEDDDVIIVNKSPETVVHVTRSHPCDTLQNALYHYWEERGEQFKTRFVNRLDMDTSGIVVVAKNKYVHHFIQSQGQEGRIDKKYLLICTGTLKKKEGVLDYPITRPSEDSIKRVVSEEGKSCITKYRVLEEYDGYSLVSARILTGRTHQIRVHFSHIGHPIIGDSLYNPYENRNEFIKRQALHAFSISFIHPRSGKVTYTADLPDDMQKAIQRIKML